MTEKDKRSAILNATLDLIAERGFHGTPMSQVAKRSCVSAGIIYHYFDGKDALIHALYHNVKTEYVAALLQGEPQELPWPQSMIKMWRNCFNFHVENPKATIFLEQYENSPYYDPEYLHNEDSSAKEMVANLKHLLNAGLLRPMPFEVFYELTLGVAIGLAKRQINGSLQADDAMLDMVAEACLRAVSA